MLLNYYIISHLCNKGQGGNEMRVMRESIAPVAALIDVWAAVGLFVQHFVLFWAFFFDGGSDSLWS